MSSTSGPSGGVKTLFTKLKRESITSFENVCTWSRVLCNIKKKKKNDFTNFRIFSREMPAIRVGQAPPTKKRIRFRKLQGTDSEYGNEDYGNNCDKNDVESVFFLRNLNSPVGFTRPPPSFIVRFRRERFYFRESNYGSRSPNADRFHAKVLIRQLSFINYSPKTAAARPAPNRPLRSPPRPL